MNKPMTAVICSAPPEFESEHREASLNWLALGLLLSAWNASVDDVPRSAAQRPAALRGYAYVSVRAAQRMAAITPRSPRG
jgi:hypothetical protein